MCVWCLCVIRWGGCLLFFISMQNKAACIVGPMNGYDWAQCALTSVGVMGTAREPSAVEQEYRMVVVCPPCSKGSRPT
jgi:hypothetical protein